VRGAGMYETCPISTGGGTRRVQLVREGGGEEGGVSSTAYVCGSDPRMLRKAKLLHTV